jgi:hypothetical protein
MATHIPPVTLARRDYWKSEAERAAERGDFTEARVATRIVREYDHLIEELRNEHRDGIKASRRGKTSGSSALRRDPA